MKSAISKCTAFLVSLIALPICLAHADSVAGSAVQVDVSSSIEPATGVGLLISAGKTIQKVNPKIEKAGPGAITVTIPYSNSEISSDTVATALVVSDKGEVVFGNVRPVLGTELDAALATIPLCSDDQVNTAALSGQLSLLEELYRIRVKRRDEHKNKAARILSGNLLERLQKLERGFGLAREKELSADLTAFELLDRVSRLRDALKNWEKKKEPTPTPAPLEEESAEPVE
jgi:hypothetical protein